MSFHLYSSGDVGSRLKEVAERTNRCGYTLPTVLSPLRHLSVRQCIVGASHIAFLLEGLKPNYHLMETKEIEKGPGTVLNSKEHG
ncbi:UBR5 [Cordylochernes scorpioides]|uniref:UBR5 n=1 Tax=Cordylochernes scorpioides TaxID=51811 RepID=A0ABY6JX08_9ARAC|nr:UBR5 [Cordylochernes scorpioides]